MHKYILSSVRAATQASRVSCAVRSLRVKVVFFVLFTLRVVYVSTLYLRTGVHFYIGL
jgi:hypothetical protein